MIHHQVIHQRDTKVFKNSPKCIAYEYSHNDKDINIASVEIKGRYPDFGRVMNEKAKELIFVTRGSGKLIIDKKMYSIKEGTAVLLLPKQQYYLKGNLTLIAACTPAWTQQQHKHIQSP